MQFDIYFRSLELDDAEFINTLRKNVDMENLIGGVKRFVSLERETKWIEDIILKDNQFLTYVAICEKCSNKIVGYTSISEIDYRNGKCFWSGIKIDPPSMGKGYAFQAELLILKYIFDELRMVRCRAECLEEHEVALKLMLKAGFVKEGIMRKYVYKNGQHKNCWLLSILKEEYDIIKGRYEL